MDSCDSGVVSCDKTQFRHYLETILKTAGSPGRVNGTLPSVLTSADVKLTYDETNDQFCPFIIGDINANPEGIAVHDAKITEDLPEIVASQLISNIQGSNLQVVVSLPGKVYDENSSMWKNPDSWLTRDKRVIVQSLQQLSRIECVYLTSDAAGISTTEPGAGIEYTPPDGKTHPVDGYVNLHDLGESLGEALGNDPELYSLGANSPTAVWNPHYPRTNKIGMLRMSSKVLVGNSEVRLPRYQKVHTVDDIKTFLQMVERPIVLKGPYGTWGDEVVTIRSSERAEQRILEKERIVQNKRGWSSFSIFNLSNGEIEFKSRSGNLSAVPYGHVEEAIENKFERNGHIYDTVGVTREKNKKQNACPIDFVPLITREGNFAINTPSIMLRISGRSTLNANAESDFITHASLHEAFERPVTISTPDGDTEFDLKMTLENIADRTVKLPEIRRVLELAGSVAFTARNLSAYAAEGHL